MQHKTSHSVPDASTVVCDTIAEGEKPQMAPVNKSPFLRTNNWNYYWTNQFPYIAIKKRRLMGKIRAPRR